MGGLPFGAGKRLEKQQVFHRMARTRAAGGYHRLMHQAVIHIHVTRMMGIDRVRSDLQDVAFHHTNNFQQRARIQPVVGKLVHLSMLHAKDGGSFLGSSGALCDAGYEVSLETSGAIDVAAVDARVRKVVDLKAPGSGEVARNLFSNLDHVGARDQVKIVIADRADYEWARDRVAEYDLPSRCQVLFSPVYTKLAPRELAEWILADRLPVRFQMQLHKALWGETPGT